MTGIQHIIINSKQPAALLKAMSNERRLQILCLLSEGEKSVGTLEQMVGISQSALSQHLARLRRDSLVTTRRDAQTIYYSLNGSQSLAVITTLSHLFSGKSTPALVARGRQNQAAE